MPAKKNAGNVLALICTGESTFQEGTAAEPVEKVLRCLLFCFFTFFGRIFKI